MICYYTLELCNICKRPYNTLFVKYDYIQQFASHKLYPSALGVVDYALLARVAAQGSPCRNAAGTDVAIVVDTLVPVTVGAPGGERAVRGGELSATACRAWWLILTFFFVVKYRQELCYLLPSAYLQLMPPAMQVRSPWQLGPLRTHARASRFARSTISWEGLGAAMASPRKRTMEVKTLADSILAVKWLFWCETADEV